MGLKELQRDRLLRYIEAERAILLGQSYVLEGRSLTRADLSAVRRAIDDLIASGVTLEDEPRRGRSARAVFVE